MLNRYRMPRKHTLIKSEKYYFENPEELKYTLEQLRADKKSLSRVTPNSSDLKHIDQRIETLKRIKKSMRPKSIASTRDEKPVVIRQSALNQDALNVGEIEKDTLREPSKKTFEVPKYKSQIYQNELFEREMDNYVELVNNSENFMNILETDPMRALPLKMNWRWQMKIIEEMAKAYINNNPQLRNKKNKTKELIENMSKKLDIIELNEISKDQYNKKFADLPPPQRKKVYDNLLTKRDHLIQKEIKDVGRTNPTKSQMESGLMGMFAHFLGRS